MTKVDDHKIYRYAEPDLDGHSLDRFVAGDVDLSSEKESYIQDLTKEEYMHYLLTRELPEDFNKPADKPTEGVKFDQGKTRYELLPPEFLAATADILTFGAAKYGDRNWEKGMHWSRVFGALMRHLMAWWAGNSKDDETGKSHLWHAACCLAFLIAYEARGAGTDDRV